MTNFSVTVYPQVPSIIQIEEKVAEKILLSCTQGPAGASSDGFDAECAQDILIGKICYLKSDGKMYIASIDDPYLIQNHVGVFGVPITTLLSGSLGSFRQRGQITFSGGLESGKTYFLGLNGNITSIPPTTGLLLEVGLALSTTKFILNIKEAILLR